ncbi:MAG: hypothetical protein ACRYFV_20660 [Janthinobacterium lividum]
MKVNIPCIECVSAGDNTPYWADSRPVSDSLIYDVTCPKGHKTEILLAAYKFELLFESGVVGLRAGYYREAVSSFATALERFYEFSIIFFIIDKFDPKPTGHFDENAVQKFLKLWKIPLKFSERQIGAFYALYFNEFDELPVLFDEAFSKSLKHIIVKNPVNLRNRVVHEGYIPTYEEAIQYGEAVAMYIKALVVIYRERDHDRKIPRIEYIALLERALAFIKRGEAPRDISLTNSGTFISDIMSKYPADTSLIKYVEQRS